MIELRIEALLKEKGITKTEFAEKMGVRKQNVNLLLQSTDLRKLEKIADVLNIELTDLIKKKPVEAINGYVEINGIIHKIKSRQDIENLLKEL